MLGLIVNPVAWCISTFVMVYAALLGLVSNALAPYDPGYRRNNRMLAVAFLAALMISALNAAAGVRGGA